MLVQKDFLDFNNGHYVLNNKFLSLFNIFNKRLGDGMKELEARVDEIAFHMPEGYVSLEKWLEKVGRTCYKSEDKITEESAARFINMLRERGHHAMLEHAIVSARIIGDRGLTHELVRHRIASYAQESTRYCNYSKGKFGEEITVITQPGLDEKQTEVWQKAMFVAEENYLLLIKMGVKPEIARSVLPIGLKAEIVITTNLREWLCIFELRCDKSAHPIIRKVCLDILNEFNNRLPCVYEKTAIKFGIK